MEERFSVDGDEKKEWRFSKRNKSLPYKEDFVPLTYLSLAPSTLQSKLTFKVNDYKIYIKNFPNSETATDLALATPAVTSCDR